MLVQNFMLIRRQTTIYGKSSHEDVEHFVTIIFYTAIKFLYIIIFIYTMFILYNVYYIVCLLPLQILLKANKNIKYY